MKVQIMLLDKNLKPKFTNCLYLEHHNNFDDEYREFLVSLLCDNESINVNFSIGEMFFKNIFTKSELNCSSYFKEKIKTIREELLKANKNLLEESKDDRD